MTISYILMFLLIIILILIICSIIVNSIQNTYDQPIKKLGGVFKNGNSSRIYKGGTIEQLLIEINAIIAEWPTLDIDTIKQKIQEKIQRAIEFEKALCKEEKMKEIEAYTELLMQKSEEFATAEYDANIHFQRLMSDYLPILSMIETDILKKNENNKYDKELTKVSELISNIGQNYYTYLDNENKELSNYIQMWITGISDKLANSDKLQQANDEFLQVIQVQNKMIEMQKQTMGELQKISTIDNDMKLLDNALSKQELGQLLQLIYRNMEDINKMKDTHRDVKKLDIALAKKAMLQAVELAKGMKDIENMKEEYEEIIQKNSEIIRKANKDIKSYLNRIENLNENNNELAEENIKLLQIFKEMQIALSTVEHDGEKFKADVMRSAMEAYSEQNDKIRHLEALIQIQRLEFDSVSKIIQDIAHIVGTDYDSQHILDKIQSIVITNSTLQNELSDKINQNDRQKRIILKKDKDLAEKDEELAEQREKIDIQNDQNSTLLELLDKKEKFIEAIKSELIENLESYIVEIKRGELSISKLTKENTKIKKENTKIKEKQIEIISENTELAAKFYAIYVKMEQMKIEHSTQIQNLTDKLGQTYIELKESSKELIAAKTQIQENEEEITEYKKVLLEESASVSILQNLYNAVTEKLSNFSTNSSHQISKLKKMTKKLFTRISIL